MSGCQAARSGRLIRCWWRFGGTNHRGTEDTEDTEEGHRGVGGAARRSRLKRRPYALSTAAPRLSGTPPPTFRHNLSVPTFSRHPSESRQPPSPTTEPSVFITLCPLCLCGSFPASEGTTRRAADRKHGMGLIQGWWRFGGTNHRGTEDTEEGHRGVGGAAPRTPLNQRHNLSMPTTSLQPSESRQPPSPTTEPSVFITLCPLCLCGSFPASEGTTA